LHAACLLGLPRSLRPIPEYVRAVHSDALRGVDAEEAKRFVRMVDEMEFEPETLALEVQNETK